MTDPPFPEGAPGAIDGGLHLTLERHADLILVTLAGPLDIYTGPGFRANLDARARECDQIVVDLSEVALIDSSGLGALVGLRNQSQRDGSGQLGLICPRRRVRRIFEITGLRQAFVFGPDLLAVRAALAAATTPASPHPDSPEGFVTAQASL